jgi:GT2 family glycosyltransferase
MDVRPVSLQEESEARLPDALLAAAAHDRPAGQKRLCLVGTAFRMSDGGAEHLRRMIEAAVKADFNVTLVDVGALPGRTGTALDALAVGHSVDVQYCEPCAIEAAVLRPTIALFRHLRAQQFDAILFQDHEGIGYASIIAKQTGLAFAETALGVVAFGSSRWRREHDHRFPASLVTIATEYIEQRAVELGDVVILPSQQIARWMQQAGWRLGTTLSLPKIAETTSSDDNAWAGILQEVRPADDRPTARRGEGMRPDDVTVVIAHFEQPALLDQNLEALTHQTDKNFSVLVVDDGSRSAEAFRYLAGIEEQYRTLDLRLLRQDNRYLGAARNAGIRAANTDFIILLDDDNVAFPDMVRILRRAIHLAGADVVTCGIRHFDAAAGRPRLDVDCGGSDQFFSGGPVLLGAVHNCFGDASGIYRKAVFDEVGYFHELRGVTFEDWQMHLRIVASGFRLLSLPEPLVWYRVRADSMLRTTRRYDNARVIASTVDGIPCSKLGPLVDYLMGMEEEQVRLNDEITRLTADARSEAGRAVAAANTAALLEARDEACRYAHSLEEVLDARTRSAKDAEDYARSLEAALAELRQSHQAATEYAISLETSRAEIETYAKHLETEYCKIKDGR